MAGTTGAQALSTSQAAVSASASQATVTASSSLSGLAWLSGIGGGLGSGIESGFVAVLKDMWKVLAGPVFIAIGVFILLFTLARYNQGDLPGLGRISGMTGMAAA